MLAHGKRRLLTADAIVPQYRSMGNAQAAHTGPVASMLSAICRRAWIVSGQAERRSFEC